MSTPQLGVEDACEMLGIAYPVRIGKRAVAKMYNTLAKKLHPDKAGAVSEKRKREDTNRMQDLVNARDLVYKLQERNAWQGLNEPLIFQNDYLGWNCEIGDKILVSRHHCTTIA